MSIIARNAVFIKFWDVRYHHTAVVIKLNRMVHHGLNMRLHIRTTIICHLFSTS